MFEHAERRGLHILPVHYYSPIPDLQHLKLDDQTPRFIAATPQVLDSATKELADLVDCYGEAFTGIRARPRYAEADEITEFRFGIAPYSTVEAEALYGLIRQKQPARIIEIGCGHTTLLISEAIRAEYDIGYSPDYICIDPYRPTYLKKPPREVSRFMDTSLQSVPLDLFCALRAGDVLFIDSSHVVSYGSDTVYELTSILPELHAGVLVHIHDIFLPYEYPTEWLRNSRFFWNEQYMLATLLRDNPRYKIYWPLHQLYRERHDALLGLFPLLSDATQRPGAYWIEVM